MNKWIKQICIIGTILLISTSAFALVPVDKAVQEDIKKQDQKKTSKSGEKKEKAENKNKDKGKKEKQEKDGQTDKTSDE